MRPGAGNGLAEANEYDVGRPGPRQSSHRQSGGQDQSGRPLAVSAHTDQADCLEVDHDLGGGSGKLSYGYESGQRVASRGSPVREAVPPDVPAEAVATDAPG